jgi:hypothetical protein
MARSKRIPQPSARMLEQRPRLTPEANWSNHRADELDAQLDWQARIDAGLIKVTR